MIVGIINIRIISYEGRWASYSGLILSRYENFENERELGTWNNKLEFRSFEIIQIASQIVC